MRKLFQCFWKCHTRTEATNGSEGEALVTASVAEWLRVWDTLTMFEATVCGRS